MAQRRLPGEFDIIARHFRPLAAGCPGALGLNDDAALIDVDPGQCLVVTADALVAGVHFLDTDPAELIARKMLRVNLSDLAAMGARPLAYFLTIALSDAVDEPWLESFSSGLAHDQAEFSVALMGGDITATPGPLTLSVTALGQVAKGRALRRSGACAGDCLMVSGTIGDAALGLQLLRGALPALQARYRAFLTDRYHLPRPRLGLGQALSEAGMATAALDVSDGLVGDIGHICETSGCGAVLDAARVPLSEAARVALDTDPTLRRTILTGGDDYELLLAVRAEHVAEATALGERLGVPLTTIGRFTDGAEVQVEDESGKKIHFGTVGYRHF